MNSNSDQNIRNSLRSLDGVKPPTNWNPDNTWKRIKPPAIYYRRKVVAVLVMVFLALFLFIFTADKRTQTPLDKGLANHSATETTYGLHISKSLGDVIKETTDSSASKTQVHQPFLAESNTSLSQHRTPSAPIQTPTQKNLGIDSLVHRNRVSIDSLALEIDSILKTIVHSRPLEIDSNSEVKAVLKKKKINLNITITIHAEKKPKPKNMAKHSIIKIKGANDFQANKKFYSVQLFK